MSDISRIAGLPKEVFDLDAINRETSKRLKVYATKKRFNKLVTIVEGLTGDELTKATKELKHKLACGGSCKEGFIVLQGDHKDRAVEELVKMGYPKDVISVG